MLQVGRTMQWVKHKCGAIRYATHTENYYSQMHRAALDFWFELKMHGYQEMCITRHPVELDQQVNVNKQHKEQLVNCKGDVCQIKTSWTTTTNK